LPLSALSWGNFEKLCARVAALDGEVLDARRFGIAGQGQDGIDVLARRPDGTVACYQARRIRKLSAASIRSAVDEFLDGRWAESARKFVYFTSHEVESASVALEVETQRDRLAALETPIDFEAMGVVQISDTLESEALIVRRFFGPAWLERFVPPTANDRRLSDDYFEPVVGRIFQTTTRVIVLDSGSVATKEALKALNADVLARLYDAVNDPPDVHRICLTIEDPPDWAAHGGPLLWIALARLAEEVGEWSAAATAWGRASPSFEDARSRAGAAAQAMIAAEIAREGGRVETFRQVAREAEPNHPRLVLYELDRTKPPAEQLMTLAPLETTDPAETALIASYRAGAYLLMEDLSGAREQLTAAEEAAPDSVPARATRLNVTVQEARLASINARRLDTAALRVAYRDALKLRDDLKAQRRFGESAQLLMIAADIQLLQCDRQGSRRLLNTAQPEELEHEQPAIALAVLAMRALDFHAVRRFLARCKSSGDVELLQAVAACEVGTAAERTEAVDLLDAKLAAEEPGSDQQAEAAYYRLTACISPARAVWSEEAERVLVETEHRRAAIIPKAFIAALHHGSYEEARDLLIAEGEERWAIATRLHLAGAWGQRDELVSAAQAALAISPSQDLRVEAGVALLRAGRAERGVEVLNDAADSNDTPTTPRADAYHRLVSVAIRDGEWTRADELHKRWVHDTPGDQRASALGPAIARRRREGAG
jgi:hypothetical protein